MPSSSRRPSHQEAGIRRMRCFLVLAQADRSAQSKKRVMSEPYPPYVPSERVMLDLLGSLRRLFWKPASSNPWSDGLSADPYVGRTTCPGICGKPRNRKSSSRAMRNMPASLSASSRRTTGLTICWKMIRAFSSASRRQGPTGVGWSRNDHDKNNYLEI